MKPSPKPVRECHGCGLNLGSTCGVYPNPREMWKRHETCPGYKNEELLRRYQEDQARHPADPRRKKRQIAAKLRATVPHRHGRLNPEKPQTRSAASPRA